ncbi:hypothetical protein [Corynebacterium terpenotabidum]|uniref:hypothetical protein n=1 Tax=Corynebacterium terpenotabidum TaxID=89154 RepID=UPI0012ED2004|nr:hypothetical protein [Corynebacterium terpenotabidum]
MTNTRWWRYVTGLLGQDNYSEAASRAGFDKSAFTRWKKGAAADPAFAVKLARAYGSNVLEALVEAELITEQEADLRQASTRPRAGSLTSDELLSELSNRLRNRP